MLHSVEGSKEAIEKTGLIHRVYLPEETDRTGATAPVIFLVHGRAGHAGLMWTFSKTFERFKPAVIAPQGYVSDPIGAFSWWHPEFTELMISGDESLSKRQDLRDAVLRLKSFIDSSIDFYKLKGRPIYAAGFSQGSAVTASLSLLYPELFQGVAILAGFLPKIVTDSTLFIDEAELHGKQLPKYFIAHGSQDETIPLARAERTAAYLRGIGADVEFVVDDVGHKVGTAGMKALQAWFESALG